MQANKPRHDLPPVGGWGGWVTSSPVAVRTFSDAALLILQTRGVKIRLPILDDLAVALAALARLRFLSLVCELGGGANGVWTPRLGAIASSVLILADASLRFLRLVSDCGEGFGYDLPTKTVVGILSRI
jgi:hypothetical protein